MKRRRTLRDVFAEWRFTRAAERIERTITKLERRAAGGDLAASRRLRELAAEDRLAHVRRVAASNAIVNLMRRAA